jgi:hypothetical protein
MEVDKENKEGNSSPEPFANASVSHKCNLCPKRSFRYAKDLAKHRLVHTGEKPHACGACDRKFRNTSNLYKHVRLKHGKDEEKRLAKLPILGNIFSRVLRYQCNVLYYFTAESENRPRIAQ